MVSAMGIEHDVLFRQIVTLALVDISRLFHLREHHIPALLASFSMTHRIKVRRILAKSYQHSGFLHAEVLRLLIEVSVCRRLDSHSIM